MPAPETDRRARAAAGAREGIGLGVIWASLALLGLPLYWEGPLSLLLFFALSCFSLAASAGMGAALALGSAELGDRKWLVNGLWGVPAGVVLALVTMLIDPSLNPEIWIIGVPAGFLVGVYTADWLRARLAVLSRGWPHAGSSEFRP